MVAGKLNISEYADTLQPMWTINNQFFFYIIGFFIIVFILALASAIVLTRESHNVMVLENPNLDVHSQQRVLVAFKTSPLCGSGCSDNATISLVIQGVKAESATFILSRQQYPYRKFLRGNLDLFLLHFDRDIGYVRGVKILVDNAETRPFTWHISEISTYDPDCRNKVHFVIPDNKKLRSPASENHEFVFKPCVIRSGNKFKRIIEYILTNHYIFSIASPVHLRNFGRVARVIFIGFIIALLCFACLVTYVISISILTTITTFDYLLFSHVTYVIVFLIAYMCAFILENSRPRISEDAARFPETQRKSEDEKVSIRDPPKGSATAFKLHTIEESDETLAALNYESELLRSKLWHRRLTTEDATAMSKGSIINQSEYGYFDKQAKGELKAIHANIKGNETTIENASKEVISKVITRAKTDTTLESLEKDTNKLRRHYKRQTAGDSEAVNTSLKELNKQHDTLQLQSTLALYNQLTTSKKITYDDMANYAKTQQILVFCGEKLGNIQAYHNGKLEKFYDIPYFRVDPSRSVQKSLRAVPSITDFHHALHRDPKTVYRTSSEKVAVDIKQESSFESPDHVTIHSLPQISHQNRLGIAADAIVDYAVHNARDLLSTHTVTSIRDNLQKFCDILIKDVLHSDEKQQDTKTMSPYTLREYKRLIEHFAKCYVTNEIKAQNTGLSLKTAMTDSMFFPTRETKKVNQEYFVFPLIFTLAEESYKAGLRGEYESGESPLSKGKEKKSKDGKDSDAKRYAASKLIPAEIFQFDRRQVLAHLKVNPHFKQTLIDVLYDFSGIILAQDMITYIEKIVSMEKQYEMLNDASNQLAKNIQRLVSIWKELQKNDNLVIDVLLVLLAADLRQKEIDSKITSAIRSFFSTIWDRVAEKEKIAKAEIQSKSSQTRVIDSITVVLVPRVIRRAIDETFVELENPLYMFHKSMGITLFFDILAKSMKSLKTDWIRNAVADAKLHYDRQGYFRIENTGEFLSRSIMCEYLSGRLNNRLEADINETSPNLDKFNVLLLKRVEYYFLVNITEKYKEVTKYSVQRLLQIMDQELRFCQHLRVKRDYIASYIVQCIDRMAELCKRDPIVVLAQILRNQLIETRRAINLQHLNTTVDNRFKLIDVTKEIKLAPRSKECKEVVDGLLELRSELKFLDNVSEATNKIARSGYVEKEQPFISDQVMVNMQQVIDSRNMYVANDETRKALWYYRSIIVGEHKNLVGYRWRQFMMFFMWAVIIGCLVFTAIKGIDLNTTEAAWWTASVFIGFLEDILVFELIRLAISHAYSTNWRIKKAPRDL